MASGQIVSQHVVQEMPGQPMGENGPLGPPVMPAQNYGQAYAQMGQIAMNEFKGFGDAIIGVDVTMDGKWIVATTKNYLLVLKTVAKGHPDINGFNDNIKRFLYVTMFYQQGLKY